MQQNKQYLVNKKFDGGKIQTLNNYIYSQQYTENAYIKKKKEQVCKNFNNAYIKQITD
jgi:hypothetical protein